MKTTLDIPENELQDAISFTKARTKREAIVTVVTDFNRRKRMAELVKHLGTCKNMMTLGELKRMREEK